MTVATQEGQVAAGVVVARSSTPMTPARGTPRCQRPHWTGVGYEEHLRLLAGCESAARVLIEHRCRWSRRTNEAGTVAPFRARRVESLTQVVASCLVHAPIDGMARRALETGMSTLRLGVALTLHAIGEAS